MQKFKKEKKEKPRATGGSVEGIAHNGDTGSAGLGFHRISSSSATTTELVL